MVPKIINYPRLGRVTETLLPMKKWEIITVHISYNTGNDSQDLMHTRQMFCL